ncbi:MAG: hypothetical protein ABS949_02080 [Solibacillus sp.]
MEPLQPFIDAYLAGDSLFRFVYKPVTDELFLEEELDEADNGKFYYVPFKDSRELYSEMSYFVDEQDEWQNVLLDALSSPSPISKFEQVVAKTALADAWRARKMSYAKKHLLNWFADHGIKKYMEE